MKRTATVLIMLMCFTYLVGCATANRRGEPMRLEQRPISTMAGTDTQDSLETTPNALSPENLEMRELTHRSMLAGNGQHDGAIWLAEHGDMSSVPALMKALEDNKPPPGEDAAVCTYGHAVDALRKITGRDVGWKYADWKVWYEEFQVDQAPQ